MKIRIAISLALLVLIAPTLACGSSAPAGVSNTVLSTDKAGTNKTTTFSPTNSTLIPLPALHSANPKILFRLA